MSSIELSLEELLEMLQTAASFDIAALRTALEDAASELLTADTCGRILKALGPAPLPPLGAGTRLTDACRELALCRFDAFAATPGFLDIDEDILWHLLAEEALTARSEEAVFDAVVRWMTCGGQGSSIRGERLLGRVRFPLMARSFLAERARYRLPDCPRLEEALREALAVKDAPTERRRASALSTLEPRTLTPRVQVRRAALSFSFGKSPR